MKRKFWISLHLYCAAFFSPVLLLMAFSGGLYLLGVKGSVTRTDVNLDPAARVDLTASDLEAQVRRVLEQSGIRHDFQYLKRNGNDVLTRPTSRDHYQFTVTEGSLTATRNRPDLQKRLLELHMGHGPAWFRHFQKLMAAGVLVIVGTGAWLGLSAPALRKRMWLTTLTGVLLSLILAV